MPLYVTWVTPPERCDVPSIGWFTPAPAFGLPVVTSGGQAAAHAP
jgi:hypothetical protein